MNPVTATKAPSVIANAPRRRITAPRPRKQFCATAFNAVPISEERLCLPPAGCRSGCTMGCRDKSGNDSGGSGESDAICPELRRCRLLLRRLPEALLGEAIGGFGGGELRRIGAAEDQIGRASCRERVWPDG